MGVHNAVFMCCWPKKIKHNSSLALTDSPASCIIKVSQLPGKLYIVFRTLDWRERISFDPFQLQATKSALIHNLNEKKKKELVPPSIISLTFAAPPILIEKVKICYLPVRSGMFDESSPTVLSSTVLSFCTLAFF